MIITPSSLRPRLALVGAMALMTIGLAEGCKHKETFPALGTKIASPVDVVTSSDGKYFYVLNTDMDRTYNQGSVLVMDKDGTKLSAVAVPRMGRSLSVAGTDMLVTIDYEDDVKGAQLVLLSLKDPAAPTIVKTFDLSCSPYNAVLREDHGSAYKYFAMTCVDGGFYVGELTDDRAASTLHHVRTYEFPRHAIHIDPQRGLIFTFVTDTVLPTTNDYQDVDEATYDDNASKTADVADEIPDNFQNEAKVLSARGNWQNYQFICYDVAAEAAAGFPLRTNTDPVYAGELRWLYFKLANFDGTPDDDAAGGFHSTDPSWKYYRTNFWAARPDPDDSNVFYLSHRGAPTTSATTGSPFANQIVKVTLVGDPHAKIADTQVTTPHTGDIMSFERVYGFKGAQATAYSYPGDFKIADVQGQRIVLVNNFRDLVNWTRSETYFSVVAATLGSSDLWFAETTNNTDPLESWYQVAVDHDGHAMSLSFYGNAVMLFDVQPGVGITAPRVIK